MKGSDCADRAGNSVTYSGRIKHPHHCSFPKQRNFENGWEINEFWPKWFLAALALGLLWWKAWVRVFFLAFLRVFILGACEYLSTYSYLAVVCLVPLSFFQCPVALRRVRLLHSPSCLWIPSLPGPTPYPGCWCPQTDQFMHSSPYKVLKAVKNAFVLTIATHATLR